VRDALLNEALRRLATEAATRFSMLVAGGEQIPFDVAECEGPDSLFHSYVPLTGRFVREHENEVRALGAFEPAREAVDLGGVAAPYLEGHGEPVPAESGERAARMLVVFLASLWDGSTDFALDRDRLDRALAVLDAEVGAADDADVLIAPVAGLRMSVPRLPLPRGVQLVRADAFDAPIEAMRSEGMARAAWEPQFLAIAEQGEDADSAAAALRQLHDLISVMRLFKPGGVALGPHAFAPTGEGQWRRIATGAPAPRGDGYRLDDAEAEQLAELARTLESRPDPSGSLAWAVRRFERGCERENAVEGLSDHLLALRAVLEGHGPVGATLPMRAAALISAGSVDRLAAREQLEAALELERSLMGGAASAGSAELATWVEDGVRRILREAALGELGTDLGEAADETLIATGLDAGDAEIAIAAETEAPEVNAASQVNVSRAEEPAVAQRPSPQPEPLQSQSEEDHMEDHDTRILEPIPDEDEIRITATNWLEEVEVEESTLDFPAVEGDVAHRERIDSPRVRHLFPVPENADWEVRELDYDHYDRRHAG